MPTHYEPQDDPAVAMLILEAQADPEVLGLVLLGSRSVGEVHPESDYDVTFVVADAAMARYGRGGQRPRRGHTVEPPIDTTDIGTTALSELSLERIVAWMLPAWADARVLYDRTGETTRVVEALRYMPEDRARDEAAGWYDTYLNALYRSLKAWRRGDALGGRLEAAESVGALLHTLFALERRWCPYGSRLSHHIADLAALGWGPDDVRAAVLTLLSTGDPRHQQQVARRVLALLRDRGFDDVLQGWHGRVEAALEWSFPSQ